LLAIAERGVEYNDAVTFHIFVSGSHWAFGPLRVFRVNTLAIPKNTKTPLPSTGSGV
jgi:hypothetical protein